MNQDVQLWADKSFFPVIVQTHILCNGAPMPSTHHFFVESPTKHEASKSTFEWVKSNHTKMIAPGVPTTPQWGVACPVEEPLQIKREDIETIENACKALGIRLIFLYETEGWPGVLEDDGTVEELAPAQSSIVTAHEVPQVALR